MLDIFEATHGDLLSRMVQVVDLAQRHGVSIDGYLNTQRRLQAFASILGEHPGIKDIYSDKALIYACATCELIEPPMNPVGGDETAFDIAEFERVAARVEL